MIPRILAKQGWNLAHIWVAILLAAVGVLMTLDAWKDILLIAYVDPEMSHIVLVPVVAAYLVWVRRLRLRTCPPTGQALGPIIVAGGAIMYLLGYYQAIQVAWHLGAVIVAVGCFVTVAGKHVLFRFAPAFAVLAFLVPVPGTLRLALAGPLMEYGAAATQIVLETFGVIVDRSGNLLSVNNIPVAVAEACNGMRMVFGLVLIVFAFAYGLPLRNSVRVFLLLASPAVALFCNVVRLVPTVLMYAWSTKERADSFHDLSGWVMLPIAFGVLYGVYMLLKWALVPVQRLNLAYQ